MPPGQPNSGTIHAGDAAAALAKTDLTTAYNYFAGIPCTAAMSGVDLGGKTLTPGVYCFTSSAQMTGILYLDALGDTGAVFVFQVASALTVANGSSMVLSNGAQACNVWWQVGSSATMGSTSDMSGNVLAYSSVTLNTGARLTGKALAQVGAVTMDTNSIAGLCDLPTPTAKRTWGQIKSLYR